MSGATSTNTTNAAAAVAPEITAEWTVHAQLTLSSSAAKSVDSATAAKEEVPAHGGADRSHQATAWVDGQTDNGVGGDVSSGGKVDLNFSQQPSATSSGTSATGNSGNPVKLVYKFSTTDHALPFVAAPAASYAQQNSASRERPVGKSNVIFNSDPSSPATVSSVFVQSPTGDGPQPPGIDGVTTGCSVNSQLFPKCTSTCSIVLTACTDLLPTADSIPIIINKCESTNNISVDKGTNFPEKTASNAKDVSCQTSDWETNAIQTIQTVEAEEGGSIRRRARAQRTITDDCLLSPPPRRRAEDSKFDSQSASASASAIKKKPRTVHIDVYCTGSDAETSCSSNDDDDDDDDGSLDGKSLSSHSSCSSGSRFDTSHMMELKSMAAAAASTSNPTQSQPIFESEEMRVRHKRAGKHEVPRRLMQQPIDQNTLSTIGSLKRSTSIGGGSGRQRASVAARRSVANDEINESKQILFNKHLGDMTKAAKVEDLSVYFRRDASDDAISSNYAMSNRSTRRDITGSSISSALASAGGLYEDDEDDMVHLAGDTESSNPQLNRSGTTATQSDSFEYENSEDRYRIHEMERVWNQQHWKSPSVERRLLELHNPRHASDDAEQRASMPRLLRSDSENNLTESDHSFVYDEAPTVPLSRAHDSNPSLNELSDSSPSTVKSASHPRPTERGRAILQQAILAATMQQQRQFSPVEGYTTEYLAIARRFGSLIKGRRKPGTHMGPVRNPECPCAHCRRWMMERDITSAGGPGVLRERAVSVDETMPHNIVDMRRHFHMRNLF
ncbi:uncharacterized protein LOC126578163 isoform X2 [Anopheles aquasalis]|uniref:uncharacterized protein LOC126578163 isoform X2 n=1 Tax=Anopheles aquasalis TaxID=42839 RepID=UPI00215B2A78|nr:uncharacterized protein LOC126578163 isoform X2 [Anopheles aquasalis]